jgi:uncharacterized membrane protein YccC
MDWLRGLRAAVALCAPLALGYLTGIPNLGWAALGGFEAILADNGGPYRTRMASLATLSLGGAIGLFVGSMSGGTLYTAIPVTALWCFAWSYLAVLGQPFSTAGTLVQVIYICGVGTATPHWRDAFGMAFLVLAGGAWASVLSLVLWPLDAFRPARAAAAQCYRELASFLGSISELSSRSDQRVATWHRLAQHHQYRVRHALEHGWYVLANIRATRQGETRDGRQLVVLLEHADLLIGRTVAIADHMETEVSANQSTCHGRGVSGLHELRTAEQWIASLLTRGRRISLQESRARQAGLERLPESLAACLSANESTDRFLLTQVSEAASLLASSIEAGTVMRLSAPLRTHASSPRLSSSHFAYVVERLGSLRQTWRPEGLAANFTTKSLALRHAVRVALVCGFDVALILLLHIDHGYWLLLTSLVVLQPHVSGTLRRGLERILGTVAGGILAAVLAVVLHGQMLTASVLFPLALLALAVLPVSYAAFAFFLTPTFVLAWLPYSGDWKLAAVRILNTVLGAVLAILAMIFLFPAYERDRAPRFLAASLAADRRYLAVLADSWRTGSRFSRVLAEARRATGLAHNDTEESLERLLAETWPRRVSFAEFATAFVTYLRRFAQSVTTLASLEGEREWKQSLAIQSRLRLVEKRLAFLERIIDNAVPAGTEVEPWPEPDSHSMHPVLVPQEHSGERQMQRLERQVEILHRQLRSLQSRGGSAFNR